MLWDTDLTDKTDLHSFFLNSSYQLNQSYQRSIKSK